LGITEQNKTAINLTPEEDTTTQSQSVDVVVNEYREEEEELSV
jgi:hypothetical protein